MQPADSGPGVPEEITIFQVCEHTDYCFLPVFKKKKKKKQFCLKIYNGL